MNDALAIYFADVTLASAFVAGWCASQKVETVDGDGDFSGSGTTIIAQ